MQESVVLTAELRDELSAPLEKVRKDLDGTTKTVEKANKAQAASTAEAASIMEKALNKATGAHSDMAKALEKATGRHQTAMHNQEQATARVNVAQQRLDELRSRSNTQASTLTAAENRLDDARFKQAKAINDAVTATRGLETARSDLTDATKALADAEAAPAGPLAPQVDRSKAMGTLAPAVAVVGGAVSAGFGVMLKTYADFDKAMSGVQAATHETTQNMRLLREEAIRVGADTSFSAGEAAQGIEELAKAGVSTKDILGGGLSGALDLAAAGSLGVGKAAEIAATAMTQFKLEGDQIPHLADLLAAGAGKAQGSVEDLGAALNQSGLVAAATGLSIEETTGTLAAFASAGLLGSDAGTSLKTMLQRLQAPSDKAAGLMEDLGVNMYDANGAFAGMESLAGDLTHGLGQMTQAERDAAMATMFGSDAVRAANVLYSQGAEGVAKWTEAVDDAGYAAKTAAIMQDNLAGDIEKLGGAFDTVFLQAGGPANDMLRSMTQSLEDVVDWVGTLSPEVLGVIGVLTGFLGAGLLVTGMVLALVPKITETVGAFKDLKSSSAGGATALGKVGKAAGLAAIAVAALQIVGAIFTKKDTTSAEDYANAIFKVVKAGKSAQSSDLDEIFQKWTTLGSSTKGVDTINSMTKSVSTLANQSGFDKINKNLNFMNGWFNLPDDKITQVEGKFKDLGEAMGDLAKNGRMEETRKVFRTVTEEFERNGKGAQDAMNAMPGYSDALKGIATQAGVTITDQEALTWALEGTEPAALKAARGAEALDKALEETGVTTQGLIEDMEKFIELLFAAGMLEMSDRDATTKWHGSLRDIKDTMAEIHKLNNDREADTKDENGNTIKGKVNTSNDVGNVLNKTRTDIDLTTKAGDMLNSSFQGIATAGMAKVEVAAKKGLGMDEVNKRIKTLYDGLIIGANEMGITGGAAEGLARRILQVPEGVKIESWMSEEAITVAGRTQDALDDIDKKVDIEVFTNYSYGKGPLAAPAPDPIGDFRKNWGVTPGASGGAVFMAGGGVIPGYAPGVDDVPIIASRGESVLVPELTRAIGPSNIMALNHAYSGGRPAGAGPARSALTEVLGMTTTHASGGMSASTSTTAPAPSRGGGNNYTYAPVITVTGGSSGSSNEALAAEFDTKMEAAFQEFVSNLEKEAEGAY